MNALIFILTFVILCVGLNVLIIPGLDKMKTFYNTKAQNKGKQKKLATQFQK